MGSMFGARHVTGNTPEDKLLRLTAAVDQAHALLDEAMRTHRDQPGFVDLCLDVKNTLTQGQR